MSRVILGNCALIKKPGAFSRNITKHNLKFVVKKVIYSSAMSTVSSLMYDLHISTTVNQLS